MFEKKLNQEKEDIQERNRLAYFLSKKKTQIETLEKKIFKGRIDATSGKKELFTFFDHNSPFAFWYPNPVEYEKIMFSTAGHALVYSKAKLFVDREAIEKLQKTSDKRDILEIDKNIKYYYDEAWEQFRIGHTQKIYDSKLSSLEFKNLLMDTEDTTLVYADKEDLLWGIGLEASNPECLLRGNWTGKNYLGEILTDIRIWRFKKY